MIDSNEEYKQIIDTMPVQAIGKAMYLTELIEALRNVARAAQYVMLLIEHDTGLPESAANGIFGPSGYPDEGVVRATKILGEASEALDALPAWLLDE